MTGKKKAREAVEDEVDEVKKSLGEEVMAGKEHLNDRMLEARRHSRMKMNELEGSIIDEPFKWVAGAFIAGAIFHKLLKK